MEELAALPIRFFIPLIIIFMSVFLGALLAFIAPEELKKGEKYFKLLQIALVVLTVAIFLYFKSINLFVIIAAAVFLFFLISLVKKDLSILFFALFGIFFFVLSYNPAKIFTLFGSIIFVYGLATGTLFAYKNEGKTKLLIMQDLLLRYAIFPVAAILSNMFYLVHPLFLG